MMAAALEEMKPDARVRLAGCCVFGVVGPYLDPSAREVALSW